MALIKTSNTLYWQSWEDHFFRKNSTRYHQLVWLHCGLYAQLSDIDSIVSAGEQAKAARFFSAKDRERYLLTRYAIRKLLSTLTDTPPESLIFETKQNKKPAYGNIQFNITHSAEYIYIVFSPFDVGIDAELMQPHFDATPLIENNFTDQEQTLVKTSSNTTETFYTIWTRKEALLKATGEGITDNMNVINTTADLVMRNNNNYQLHTLLHGEYVLSMATTGAELPFLFFRFIP